MASNGFLNFSNLDFGIFASFESRLFADDAISTLDVPFISEINPVNDALTTYDGPDLECAPEDAVAFGPAFSFDASISPLGGTLNGLPLRQIDPTFETSNYLFMIGINVSPVDLFNVALPPGTAGDKAMVRQILNGADEVIGPEYADDVTTDDGDDTLGGAQGNDFLNDHFGDDVLYGDNGADFLGRQMGGTDFGATDLLLVL